MRRTLVLTNRDGCSSLVSTLSIIYWLLNFCNTSIHQISKLSYDLLKILLLVINLLANGAYTGFLQREGWFPPKGFWLQWRSVALWLWQLSEEPGCWELKCSELASPKPLCSSQLSSARNLCAKEIETCLENKLFSLDFSSRKTRIGKWWCEPVTGWKLFQRGDCIWVIWAGNAYGIILVAYKFTS